MIEGKTFENMRSCDSVFALCDEEGCPNASPLCGVNDSCREFLKLKPHLSSDPCLASPDARRPRA
jgi:hypothetical protein